MAPYLYSENSSANGTATLNQSQENSYSHTGRHSAHLGSQAVGETSFSPPEPIAICGMATRLPGGIMTPQELWKFLIAKGDARCRVPKSRYNISAFHSETEKPGTIRPEYSSLRLSY